MHLFGVLKSARHPNLRCLIHLKEWISCYHDVTFQVRFVIAFVMMLLGLIRSALQALEFDMGLCFFRGRPELLFSFWSPFESHLKKGTLQRQDTSKVVGEPESPLEKWPPKGP